MNTILDITESKTTTIFFLQTEGETDVWYWQVDTADVQNYNGTLTMFVNDYANSTLGCSVASFNTLEEAKADYYTETEV